MDPDSLQGVAELSRRLAKEHFAPYSHPNSPHKFTQDQLLTCLLLKSYLNTTYRGLVQTLGVSESLRKSIGLQSPPHYTTLKKFGNRLQVRECIDAILPQILEQLKDTESDGATADFRDSEQDAARPHDGEASHDQAGDSGSNRLESGTGDNG